MVVNNGRHLRIIYFTDLWNLATLAVRRAHHLQGFQIGVFIYLFIILNIMIKVVCRYIDLPRNIHIQNIVFVLGTNIRIKHLVFVINFLSYGNTKCINVIKSINRHFFITYYCLPVLSFSNIFSTGNMPIGN